MNRHVTTPPPHTSRHRARRRAAVTARVERGEAVPGARGLERLADHARARRARRAGTARARNALRHAPAAPRAPAVAAVRRGRLAPATSPPWSRSSSSARVDPRVERVVGRLEAEHSSVAAVVGAPVSRASAGSSRRQFAGYRPGLRERARGLGARGERRRSARSPTPANVGRSCTRIHASVITPRCPRSRAACGPGTGRRPSPAGAGSPRRPRGVTRADRLDEVVDVRVQRRVVAARARREPAAERRELERLREVAQREAVRPQLVLERRAEHAGLDPRGARDVGRPRARGRARRRSMLTRAGVARRRRALDAADDGRAAAERDRGRARVARTSRAARSTSASSRGERDEVGRVVEAAAEARGPRRGTTCRRCARRARSGSVVQMCASEPGGVDPRRPAARRRRAAIGGSTSAGAKPRCSRDAGRRGCDLDRPAAAGPRSPSPRTCAVAPCGKASPSGRPGGRARRSREGVRRRARRGKGQVMESR